MFDQPVPVLFSEAAVQAPCKNRRVVESRKYLGALNLEKMRQLRRKAIKTEVISE
jgi:hypothetical protein